MRPVTVSQFPSYSIPITMRTNTMAIRNGLAANNVHPVSGVTTFNTTEVLNLLDSLTWQNKGNANWSKLNQVNQGLVISLINYFSNNDTMKYGNARGALIDNYGQYCNYCGMPVQDSALAIEHCMPKSEFPGKMLSYSNFYLSCPSCNSYKGAKPTYLVARTWALKSNNNPNFQQIVQGGFDRQLWPNSTEAWAGFPPYLLDVDDDDRIPNQNGWNLDNTLVGVIKNMVQAIIQGYNNNQSVTVATMMDTNNLGNPILQKREDNFIEIVSLNDSEEDVYSDRRVTNRTVAWLNILSSLKGLNLFPVGTDPWKVMMYQIFATAKNAGFFEIWASLFYEISGPSQGQNSVYMYFRATATDQSKPLYYFPGTNIANLPDQ